MQKKTPVTIPFYDLDPMQVVWHGNYVKYMEMGRCDLLSDLGMTYDDMAAAGVAFPVVTLRVKYMRPCVFGQRVVVVTTIVPDDNFLIFKYEIQDAQSGEKLCRAETKQMAVDLKTGNSLFEIPEPFSTILRGIK